MGASCFPLSICSGDIYHIAPFSTLVLLSQVPWLLQECYQECYQSSDRAVVVDSHADITDIKGSEGSSFSSYQLRIVTQRLPHRFNTHFSYMKLTRRLIWWFNRHLLFMKLFAEKVELTPLRDALQLGDQIYGVNYENELSREFRIPLRVDTILVLIEM
ncbi:hypothetical protein Tco_0226941 [Tanacetum coccineum]